MLLLASRRGLRRSDGSTELSADYEVLTRPLSAKSRAAGGGDSAGERRLPIAICVASEYDADAKVESATLVSMRSVSDSLAPLRSSAGMLTSASTFGRAQR